MVAGHTATGDIIMNAGGGIDQYVQIGHGGHNADGSFGDTVANGDRGGFRSSPTTGATFPSPWRRRRCYGMIGHGDGRGTYGAFGSGSSTGTRQGGIQTFVGGDLTLNAGSTTNTNVHMIHRTSTGGGSPSPAPIWVETVCPSRQRHDFGTGATGAFENQSVMAGGVSDSATCSSPPRAISR